MMGNIKPVLGTDTSVELEFLSERTIVQAEIDVDYDAYDIDDKSIDDKSMDDKSIDDKTYVVSDSAPVASSPTAFESEMSGADQRHFISHNASGFVRGDSLKNEDMKTQIDPLSVFSTGHKKIANENMLISSAMPLIHYAMSLVSIGEMIDINAVRSRLISDIGRFENKAEQFFTDQRQVVAARYLLCSFIDEIVTTSPWGLSHRWNSESLLSYFHNETYGGDGFFKLLERAQKQPQLYLDLLELMYVCLSLGFAGRYRVDSDGATKLERVRESMMTTIANHRVPDNSSLIIGGSISSDLKKDESFIKKNFCRLAYAFIALLVFANFIGYLLASHDIGNHMDMAARYAIEGSADKRPVRTD